MNTRVLALTVWFSLTGCRRDDLVLQTMADVHGLATTIRQTIQQTIHASTDMHRGVAIARAALDNERVRLTDAVIRCKQLHRVQISPALQAQWRDAFTDDLAAVEALIVELRAYTAEDPQLDAEVRSLVADYAAIVAVVPPPE